MNKEIQEDSICYGTATIGQRGQLVIPASARKKINLQPGEKVLIFGKQDQMLAIVKISQLNRVVQQFTKALGDLQQVLE